jgi:transposase
MDTLNLPGVKTEGTTETGQERVIHATVTAKATDCPKCKHTDLYAFGTRATRYIDLPMHGRQCLINLTRQRYQCRKCGHTFMPDAPGFDAQFRMTNRAVEWVEHQSSRQTFAYVAQQIGIEERSVRRVFWRYAQRKEKELIPTAGRIMGIDELHLLGKPRCILTNLKEKTVIDLLPGRKYPEVFRYLKNLDGADKIERVCIDMWRPYKQAVEAALTKVKITIDRFHVVKEANKVIEDIRKSFQKTIPHGQRLDLMRSRHILLRRSRDLNPEEKEKITRWRKLYPSLIEAWELKEQFFDIYLQPDLKAAEKEYTRWFDHLPITSHSQFRGLVHTIDNWRPEIFNFFDEHITNAYTEWANGMAKIVNRTGRGHSFAVIRFKVLYAHKTALFHRQSIRARRVNLGIPFSTFDDRWDELE